MEERGLRVLKNDTTFFSKFSSTLTKLLIPTRIGINGMMINIKRNSAIKYFEQYISADQSNDIAKKEQLKMYINKTYIH